MITMNKSIYLIAVLFTSFLFFSCKSKIANLKDGAQVTRTDNNQTNSSYSNNITKTDRGLMMTFESDLLFPTNSSYLTDQAKTALKEFVILAQEHPGSMIQVDGHTDATGTADYNQWLSEKRAASVKAHLEELGLSASRMTTTGYGQEKPVATNKTKEGRQQNRRVELTVLQ